MCHSPVSPKQASLNGNAMSTGLARVVASQKKRTPSQACLPDDIPEEAEFVRCKRGLEIHKPFFDVLVRVHLDMAAQGFKEAALNVLHLSWQKRFWPCALVTSCDHVADVGSICPCPLHRAPTTTPVPASAPGASASARPIQEADDNSDASLESMIKARYRQRFFV